MQSEVIRFQMEELPVWRAWRGSGTWVAACREFGLTAEADTWDELNRTITEIFQALLEDVRECGELDEFLQQHGWTAPALPTQCRFDVPYRFGDIMY